MQDITDFKQYLRTDPDARAFLADSRAESAPTLARAPGRLDVMGGVADYSGSLVAEMTIAEAALVALAPRTDRTLRVWSRGIEAEGLTPQVSLSLDEFYSNGGLLSYDSVHSHLRSDPQARWAAYVFGCFYVLLAEAVVPEFPNGANFLLHSRVPLGAGVLPARPLKWRRCRQSTPRMISISTVLPSLVWLKWSRTVSSVRPAALWTR